MPSASNTLRQALRERVVVADGAMGTMLQQHDLSLDDFDGLEGCNEVLNVTRPDVVRAIHEAYFAVGTDCVSTNTFGANFANLGEYDIADRIYELSRAGATIAREVADDVSTAEQPRWVLGSVGPGTKLPTLLPSHLRDPPRRLPGAGARDARRGDRCGPHRDRPGPAAGEGRDHRRQAGHCRP